MEFCTLAGALAFKVFMVTAVPVMPASRGLTALGYLGLLAWWFLP